MSNPTTTGLREEGAFYIDVGNKIRELEAQLAAERKQYGQEADTFTKRIFELAQELADEREKVEELSTALRLLKLGASSKIDRKVAAVALAKIGEKC